MRFPVEASGGKRVPELRFRTGRSFPLGSLRESVSHSGDSFRDAFSRWGGFRKARPILCVYSGMLFPGESSSGKRVPESGLGTGRAFRLSPSAETASRKQSSEWDTFSGRRLKRKFIPDSALRPGHTFRFTCRLKKTCAPSIPKLGRRWPKRNRRRSI